MKQIKNFPNYFITEFGRVFNQKGKEIKQQINIDGYYVLQLYNETGRYYKRICRLVAEAYLPDYSENLVVNHKDLNKQNDHYSNLEMVTVKDNTLHSVRNQPHKHLHKTSLTEEDVIQICKMIEDGMSNREISLVLNKSESLISRIRNGNTFTYLSKNFNLPKSYKAIDENTAIEICKYLNILKSPTKVLKEINNPKVTLDIIKHIKAGNCWKEISEIYLDKPPSTIPQGSTLK